MEPTETDSTIQPAQKKISVSHIILWICSGLFVLSYLFWLFIDGIEGLKTILIGYFISYPFPISIHPLLGLIALILAYPTLKIKNKIARRIAFPIELVFVIFSIFLNIVFIVVALSGGFDADNVVVNIPY